MPAGVYLCPSIYLPVYLSIYQSFCLSLHTRISVELSLHIFIFVCSCSQQFSNFLLSPHFFSSVLLFLCAASAFLHYPLFPSSFALLSCLLSHSLACSPSLPLSLSLSLSLFLSLCVILQALSMVQLEYGVRSLPITSLVPQPSPLSPAYRSLSLSHPVL